MKSCVPAVFSIPKDLLLKIDEIRGDVSRSRFLLRLLEKAIENKKVMK